MSARPATSEETKDLAPRRNFLKAGGALGAAGLLAACQRKPDPYSLARDKEPVPGSASWYKGEERWIATACAQCPADCGVQVRVVEGRAVKIDGSLESLLLEGKLGPKGQAGLFTLYDPDRVRGPLKRDGARGSGKWKEISWDEAIGEIAERLDGLREAGEAHRLAMLCGRQRGFMRDLAARFCAAYGTPNFFDPLSTGDGALVQAMGLMTGHAEIPGYDARNTSYILSLGSGIFESGCNGIHFSRATGMFRRGNPTRRSKIVHVEPHGSITGRMVDEWVGIRPGAYDALALGLASILVRNNLYDRAFVEAHTRGFERFQEVLEPWTPERTAEVTGIPVTRLYQLAFDLVSAGPSVVVVDARSTATSNGPEIARCALALNALLGSIERPGGLVMPRDVPLDPWPDVVADGIARQGLGKPALDGRGRERLPFPAQGASFGSSAVELLPEALLEGKPYPLEALFLYYANPLHARNAPGRFARAFETIPLIVSFSPFLDESAFQSDYILPDHTYLERWDAATPAPFGFQAAVGARRPVVEPLYDTRHSGDVLIGIAAELGGSMEESFPWPTFRAAMEARVGGIAATGRGLPKGDSRREFLRKWTQAGYWHDDPEDGNPSAAFRTPSGKFEFWSGRAEEAVRAFARSANVSPEKALERAGKASLEEACLPHAEEPRFAGDPAGFPLVFMPYKGITHAEGGGANLPALRQLAGMRKGLRAVESWDSWVELNARAAEKLGIRRGDRVWVESPAGRIAARALPSPSIPADLALMELGLGHTQFGRFARGRGANPRELAAVSVDPWSGHSPLCNTRVRVTRA